MPSSPRRWRIWPEPWLSGRCSPRKGWLAPSSPASLPAPGRRPWRPTPRPSFSEPWSGRPRSRDAGSGWSVGPAPGRNPPKRRSGGRARRSTRTLPTPSARRRARRGGRRRAPGRESAEGAERVLRRALHADVPEILVVNADETREPAGRLALDDAPPAEASGGSGGSWAPPETGLERQLAAFWEELLGRRVGRHDNFFDLGGDSLIALKLTAKIRQHLQVELPLRRLLETPTVAAPAAAVGGPRPRPPPAP